MTKKKILTFKWSLDPPPTSRTRAHNNVSKVPGAIGNAREKQPHTPLDSWCLFIDDNMIDAIIEHTNEKITELAGRYIATNLNCHDYEHNKYIYERLKFWLKSYNQIISTRIPPNILLQQSFLFSDVKT